MASSSPPLDFSQHAAANGNGAWIVSTHSARLFSRNQAITALTLAERLAVGYGDHNPSVKVGARSCSYDRPTHHDSARGGSRRRICRDHHPFDAVAKYSPSSGIVATMDVRLARGAGPRPGRWS